jgi:peroxiredoxin
VATADKAQEFYTKFPKDPNAPAARLKELDALYEAFDETYLTNLFPRFFTRANLILRDAHFDKNKKFNICYFIFMNTFLNKNLLPANIDVGAELQKNARIAERDFQDLGDVSMYFWLARDIPVDKTRPMFREFSASLQKMTVDPNMRGYAFRILVEVGSMQRDAIGKSLTFQFTNSTGQVVDTSQMKDKVIAIDFWGCSYPESITNVLHLEKLYRRFHPKGLEIIGVNVDYVLDTLKKFTSENKIEWPQCWDGNGMGPQMVLLAHTTRAGTILLIDKKGRLRDIYRDEDMDKKIEALLKE